MHLGLNLGSDSVSSVSDGISEFGCGSTGVWSGGFWVSSELEEFVGMIGGFICITGASVFVSLNPSHSSPLRRWKGLEWTNA